MAGKTETRAFSMARALAFLGGLRAEGGWQKLRQAS